MCGTRYITGSSAKPPRVCGLCLSPLTLSSLLPLLFFHLFHLLPFDPLPISSQPLLTLSSCSRGTPFPLLNYFNCFILMTIVVSPVPSGGLLLPVPPPSLLAALSSLSEQMASPPSPDLPAPRPLRLERFTRSLVPSSTVCFFLNFPPPIEFGCSIAGGWKNGWARGMEKSVRLVDSS